MAVLAPAAPPAQAASPAAPPRSAVPEPARAQNSFARARAERLAGRGPTLNVCTTNCGSSYDTAVSPLITPVVDLGMVGCADGISISAAPWDPVRHSPTGPPMSPPRCTGRHSPTGPPMSPPRCTGFGGEGSPESPPETRPLQPPSANSANAPPLRPFAPFPAGGGMYASPPPPPAASTLLKAFSSPPRTDIAPWRLPDAYTCPTTASITRAKTADPLPRKKKNRAKQAERVRRELQLEHNGNGTATVLEAA